MTIPKVTHLAPNQVIINSPGYSILQSYDSIIAVVDEGGAITLGPDWNYSVTTSKYRNQFLGLDTAETKKLIKAGEILIDPTL